ncbi:MAG: uroporphyrinogen-III synthase [Terriglobales bacterium]
MTRARGQAGALSSALRKMGATVLGIPAIEIRPPRSFRALDRALRTLSRYDWLILTSVNGVGALLARMKRLAIPVRRLGRVKIAAIGPATRWAMEAHGLQVQVMPREYVAEAVVRALRRHVRGRRVLLVRAAVARDVIPSELCRAGAQVDVVTAYRTVAPTGSAARIRAALKHAGRRPDYITFTSSLTARNFVAMVGPDGRENLAGVKLASIGPVTSATLRELGLRTHIEAKPYTIAALAKAIAKSV